jgi:mono/diheme cytochrome c family protein
MELAFVPLLAVTHHRTLPLERQAGNGFIRLAAHLLAGNRRSPVAQDPVAAIAGETAYRGCVTCHGSLGDGNGPLGRGMYPPPANLLGNDVKGESDAELFWIIKHGLSYTAMPAFGGQMSDNDLWGLVSYLRDLQGRQVLSFKPVPATAPASADSSQGVQRVSIIFDDAVAQPANLQVPAGSAELDFTNMGTKSHEIAIAAPGKVPFNAGRLAPAQILHLQSSLEPGDYTIAFDAGTPKPGPTLVLGVR